MPLVEAASWGALPGVVHGFTGRAGGVSEGNYAELNLSSRVGDRGSAVTENWRRLQKQVGREVRFASMQQVHGARVVEASCDGVSPEADGLMTNSTGVAVTVMTADCVPILLAAPGRRAVAAVHAGWRGTAARIVARAIEEMAARYGCEAGEIFAALGPSIDACCYQVDAVVERSFIDSWGERPDSLQPEVGAAAKYRVDLRAANEQLLHQAGVPAEQIERVGPCTSCAADRYFSHRASKGTAGRQIGFVALR